MRVPRWRSKGYFSLPDEFRSRNRLLDFLKKHLEPVSFMAFLSSKQSISHNTATVVQFDRPGPDLEGGGYDTSTHTFTAPYTGKYWFYTNITWLDLSTTFESFQVMLKINGDTSILRMQQINTEASPLPANAELSDNASVLLHMNEGDTVQVAVQYTDSESSATEELYGGSDLLTIFQGYKI
jgi:hypothetical protein